MIFGAALSALILGAAAIHLVEPDGAGHVIPEVEDGANKDDEEDDGGPRVMVRNVKGRSLSVAPPQRVLVYGTDSETEAFPPSRRPEYGVFPRYHHIAKTGISSIMFLLSSAVGDASTWERFPAGTPAYVKERNDFQIASIRNPCNYYVSTWSYNAEHESAQIAKELGQNGKQYFRPLSEGKGSASDIEKFRGFMKAVSGHVGVYTGRLAYGMVPCMLCDRPRMSKNFTTTWMSPAKAQKVREKLAAFNNSQVDCWVSTETLVADMTECMGKLSEDQGWPVNWTKFNASVASLETKRNPSKHSQCKRYYDAETEQLVREKDSAVFDHFGFDKCCDQGSKLATSLTRHASA